MARGTSFANRYASTPGEPWSPGSPGPESPILPNVHWMISLKEGSCAAHAAQAAPFVALALLTTAGR